MRYLNVAAEDVEVFEDGVRQRIESFHEASQPVSIVLALDASGSMRHREAEVIASAHAFAAALRPQDQLGILLFSDTTTLVQDLSTDRDATRAAIDTYKTAGGTALYDAVADALARLETAEGRRVVVAMTDGRDENNPGTAPGSRRTSRRGASRGEEPAAPRVYSIGLGTKVDARPLQQFAELSGGQTLLPQDVSQLPEEFQRVIEDLGRRYVIGYTSTNPEHDGQWRNVEIRVTERTGGLGAEQRGLHRAGR